MQRASGHAAVTPALRVGLPSPPADFSAGAGLRTRTGLALVAAGAILLLAVHVRTSFLDLQTAGLILFLTGGSWLWIPVRDKRALLRRALAGVRNYLQRDADIARGARLPLSELLKPESEPEADAGSKLPPAAGD